MQKLLIDDETILLGETQEQNSQKHGHIEEQSVIPEESFNEEALAKSNCMGYDEVLVLLERNSNGFLVPLKDDLLRSRSIILYWQGTKKSLSKLLNIGISGVGENSGKNAIIANYLAGF